MANQPDNAGEQWKGEVILNKGTRQARVEFPVTSEDSLEELAAKALRAFDTARDMLTPE